MHPKVLSADGWAVVKKLASAGLLEGWILAGGTGLALQFGHRRSEDLDFFREGPVDSQAILADLSRLGSLAVQSRTAGTLHATMDGIRLSFLETQAPFLFPRTAYRGLMIADPRDIAIMKVVAIGGRGSRKDFVDLYFYLRSGGAVDSLMELVRRRFTNVDYNEHHLLKSLIYFDDAQTEPMPRLLRRVSWSQIKKSIQAEVKRVS
jgi:hypothetical protein